MIDYHQIQGIRDAVSAALDIDSWKHSWRNNLETPEDYESAIAELQYKILAREVEINKIRSAIELARGFIRERKATEQECE